MVDIYLKKDPDLDDFRLYIKLNGSSYKLSDCAKLLNDKSAYWAIEGNALFTYIGDSESILNEFKRIVGGGKVE